MRFGFRDYDAEVGRFTCLDPLGDTGGDHDLYDYCVDDPVSLVDRAGLKEQLSSATYKAGMWDGLGGNAGPGSGVNTKYNDLISALTPDVTDPFTYLYAASPMFGFGKNLGKIIAKGGIYGAAWAADKIVEIANGEESTKVREGVEQVMPYLDNLYNPGFWVKEREKQQQ